MERIFVTYPVASGIPYVMPHWHRHMALNYIDSEGRHHVIEAGPFEKFNNTWDKALALIDEQTDGNDDVDNSPFGRVTVFRRRGKDVDRGFPFEAVAEGGDLSEAWSKIRAFADRIEREGYEYRPLHRNSNSFVAQALEEAGLPRMRYLGKFIQNASGGRVGETQGFSVPGSGARYIYKDSYLYRARRKAAEERIHTRPLVDVGDVSSMRADGVDSGDRIRLGSETNALDVLGDGAEAQREEPNRPVLAGNGLVRAGRVSSMRPDNVIPTPEDADASGR